jgi:potassium-transporting ATPase KdpC subunit
MRKEITNSIKILVLFIIITGIVYPLCISGIAYLFFRNKSEGSLIRLNGRVVGSELIGQNFDSLKYFWPRPSATAYNTMPSGGSNLGRLNPVLDSLARARKEKFTIANSVDNVSMIPSDIITASASGLDPDISPETARLQIARVSKARGFNKEKQAKLESLVNKLTEHRKFYVLGEPVINVLRLNLSLDSI